MIRLLSLLSIVFFIFHTSCRATKRSGGLKSSECSYLDSFDVRLPYYLINSKMITEKLDSIIHFVESCREFQENGEKFPLFMYLASADTGIKLIEIKASRNHVFMLDPDGFLKKPYDNKDYDGVALYLGYYVFIDDWASLDATNELPTLRPYLSATVDTLSFSAFGLRKCDTKEWLLQMDLPVLLAHYKQDSFNLEFISWTCIPEIMKPWPCGNK